MKSLFSEGPKWGIEGIFSNDIVRMTNVVREGEMLGKKNLEGVKEVDP